MKGKYLSVVKNMAQKNICLWLRIWPPESNWVVLQGEAMTNNLGQCTSAVRGIS
jgi:hypothetical protein